jgi:hypothetical protein
MCRRATSRSSPYPTSSWLSSPRCTPRNTATWRRPRASTSATGGRLARLLELPAKKLVETIAEMTPDNDEEILWAIYEAEVADDGEDGRRHGPVNRASVIAALAAKGIKD